MKIQFGGFPLFDIKGVLAKDFFEEAMNYSWEGNYIYALDCLYNAIKYKADFAKA